ncbi:EF-hand domain-containing protein [Flagellimonas sp. 389]|uniref:EF-hand domain-containing protein n=1 Tax=Flagellimonas sp. 389 TaxID=2835862 RepID=UPI001BD53290|nr:EF-hand domain-containing protein [Flagellimonas sp. 389]MBS9462216.1 EF-hand domain-containing protein [Flagellimonas sp. 389]
MKISTLKLGISIGVIGLLTSCNLKAQQGQNRERREPPSFEDLLEKMDEDEDGKLSKAEVKGRLKNIFDEIDSDEDGYITEEEFEKAPRPERSNRN